MRLCLADLSKKSRALPQEETEGETSKLNRSPEKWGEPRAKRTYRKRPSIIHLCKFCMKVCPTGETLKEHQKSHHTIECQFCGKILARIGAWENHLKVFHNVEIQVPGNEEAVARPKDDVRCQICGKEFASKSALSYHLKLHDDKTYPCEKCGKIFKHPSNLKTHMIRHESKKYVCFKCNKRFHTNFALLMHDNQSHRMAKSWKCKQCGRAFTRCAAFREHILIHTGEKPFQCPVCGARFRKIHHLKSHSKQHEDRPDRNGHFKCPDCPNVVFLHKISYDRHRRFKHAKFEVPLLSTENEMFSDMSLKREFILQSGEDGVDTSYLDFVEVEGIEMVGLDDSSVVLGTEGGQCIIELKEAVEEAPGRRTSSLEQVEILNSTTEEPDLQFQLIKHEVENNDKDPRVSEFNENQLATLQDQIQLNNQLTNDQLQQQLVMAGGKLQVQMDGETFDVYTIGLTD